MGIVACLKTYKRTHICKQKHSNKQSTFTQTNTHTHIENTERYEGFNLLSLSILSIGKKRKEGERS